MIKKPIIYFVWFIMLAYSSCAFADGSTVSKIYHPYVQILEKEIEYRTVYFEDPDKTVDGTSSHQFGYGQALSDKFFAEFYVVGKDTPTESFELESYELELKWQLSEQGQYANDWGLLFELEKETDYDVWELASTLIGLHEWPDWTATGNLSLIYEWGRDIENEIETAFSAQLRYRYDEKFEPAIELYQSQDTSGIGPVVGGLFRLSQGRKLNWDFGTIFGVKDSSPRVSWKLNLEYEFR